MAGGEGSVFGKFLLLKKIASGGMGEIFLAKLRGPVGFEKLLVVKRILRDHIENQEFVRMFFAEAQVAAKLTHSNIVQMFEMGKIEDCYFIAMEYVHGRPLRDVLDRARSRGEHLHPAFVIDIIAKVCDGISYAHNTPDLAGQEMGIIHRDLNPHNLLISYSGEVKIIDFGIAKSHMSADETETGTIKGKFVYMSPEQSSAAPLDKRSDLFSIGICTYEALTFLNPFAKANVPDSIEAIHRQDPAPLARHSPKLAPFDPIVAKALAKNRDDRYADCSDLHRDLKRLRDSGEVAAPPQTLKEFMHDLFEEQIEQEKRLLRETEAPARPVISSPTSGPGRARQSGSSSEKRHKPQREAGRDYPTEPVAHSRLPFLLLLAAILLISAVASFVVYEATRRSQSAQAATLVADLEPAPEPAPSDPQPASARSAGELRPVVAAARPSPATTEPRHEAAGETGGDLGAGPKPDNDSTDGDSAARRPGKRGKPPPPRVAAPTGKPASRVEPEPAENADGTAPASPPPPTTFGSLQVSTVPPVKVLRDGAPVGSTVKLKNPTGKLQIGSGTDPQSDPFTVRVNYKIEEEGISYTLHAEPWAIVQGGDGLGLGRTPLTNLSGADRVEWQLVNPQAKLSLRITVRFVR